MTRRALWAAMSFVAVVAGQWAPQSAASAAVTGSAIMAAGNIASCDTDGDTATAALLGARSGLIAPLGDNADPAGSAADYTSCYAPTWGTYIRRTHPTPGNHEYRTPGAAGYFGYFGGRAGSGKKGYYSYTLGSWHVVVLNSNCTDVVGGCGVGSPQEKWLRADLAAHPTACTLAYWHHPLFSSAAIHTGAGSVRPLYQALYDFGAEIVLNADAYNYERFAPQSPAGAVDAAKGIRQFVVGTGGLSHELFGTIQPNSEVRDSTAYGVLRLVLGAGEYSWQFIPIAGETFTDSGTGACHTPPSPDTGAVLLSTGDIASCSTTGDTATANLVRQLPGTIAAVGDMVKPHGSAAEFANCYDPVWGEFRARTRPVTGNHDYETDGGKPFFDYFGANAGDRAKGYYSYDVGSWHIVALNSNCSRVGGCGVGSPQEKWLRADLAAHPTACTLAYWHHPLFTSGAEHSGFTPIRPLYQALFDHHADVVLNGHSHNYERFAPQTPSGMASAMGIREFVVGTGGLPLHQFATIQPNSEARNSATWGVLKLTLRAGSYDWQFLPIIGKTFTDAGSGGCH